MANTHSVTLASASSQSLTASDSASLSFTGNHTIEFWVKLTTAPSSGGLYGLVTKDTAGASQRSYAVDYYNNAGTMQLRAFIFVDGGGANYNYSYINQTLTTGTWIHVAYVCTVANSTATKFEWFINGTSVGNGTGVQGGTGATSVYDSTTAVGIGQYVGASLLYTDGKFDDVRIWNVARTSTQISANYQNELVGNESGLVAYWKLNNSLSDSTSNGNTLTNNNSATFSTDVPFTGYSNYTQNLTETVTNTDTFIKNLIRNLTEVITNTDTLIKSVIRSLTELVTSIDTIIKSTTKNILEIVTNTDTIVRVVIRNITEIITNYDTIINIKILYIQLLETITNTDSIIRSITKNLVESVTNTDIISKGASKVVSEVMTLTDTITKLVVKILTLYETVGIFEDFRIFINNKVARWKEKYNENKTERWSEKTDL